jgi:hypothetical protein
VSARLRNGRLLGSGRRATRGGTVTVTVPLNRLGRRLVAANPRGLRAWLRFTAVGQGRAARTIHRAFSLRSR